jgi:asparagine synthase (glutamine-hydrolysing)
MCGIAGEFVFSRADALDDTTLARMVASIRHRGPDQQAHVRKGHVALGIARLSIIDPTGSDQPITNETGDMTLVFNGEIYNFKELRNELEGAGHVFRTRGDGETIVHGYEEWGLELLPRLRGMFAFALWDERSQRLILARDRMGIKPLYLWRNTKRVMFASEAKALLTGGVSADVNEEMLDCYLTFRYVPAPRTLFKGIDKLRPGEVAIITSNGIEMRAFSSIQQFPKRNIGENDAAAQLLELLRRSVEYRLQSDAALGVFLSGGLDSGFLVALTREFKDGPLDTYSIGFDRGGVFNEIPAAEIVAKRYATTQHSVLIDHRQFASQLADAVYAMDEPMPDPSSVPMRILSLEANKRVKVILSGEGSDELFAGYGRYVGERFAGYSIMPQRAAAAAAAAARRFLSRRSLKAIEGVAIRDATSRHLFWQTIVPPALRQQLLSKNPVTPQVEPLRILRDISDGCSSTDSLEQLFYFDLRSWLVEDLLLKKDKMGMSASIEARVPYLDQDVVDFAATLPASMKLRGTRRKYIFRKVIAGYLPDEILNRPKVGFAVPLADWFRGDLRGLTERCLLEPGGFLDDYLSMSGRRHIVEAHLRGEDLSLALYALIVLELWGRVFCRGEAHESLTEQVLVGL